MAKKRKFKNIVHNHGGQTHKIIGRVTPGSLADYVMLVRNMKTRTDDYILHRFKNGKQLLFNTKFIARKVNDHGELHCELCGKQKLKLYYWWQQSSEKRMATADHFFPKSLDKDKLSFDLRNMIVACYSCNHNKGHEIYDISSVKFPYPGTIDRLQNLKNKLDL